MNYDPTDDIHDREDERTGRFGEPDRQDGTEYMRPVGQGAGREHLFDAVSREKTLSGYETGFPCSVYAVNPIVEPDREVDPASLKFPWPIRVPKKTAQASFDEWWYNAGSAMRPNDGEDFETFAHRVCGIAWAAAVGAAPCVPARKDGDA